VLPVAQTRYEGDFYGSTHHFIDAIEEDVHHLGGLWVRESLHIHEVLKPFPAFRHLFSAACQRAALRFGHFILNLKTLWSLMRIQYCQSGCFPNRACSDAAPIQQPAEGAVQVEPNVIRGAEP
jgi:hypothetical protein